MTWKNFQFQTKCVVAENTINVMYLQLMKKFQVYKSFNGNIKVSNYAVIIYKKVEKFL